MILEITSAGTSARRRCCWAMSCCRRRLGTASSVHTYTAPGRPRRGQRPAASTQPPSCAAPWASPLTQGGAGRCLPATWPTGCHPGGLPPGRLRWEWVAFSGACAFRNTPSCRHGGPLPGPMDQRFPDPTVRLLPQFQATWRELSLLCLEKPVVKTLAIHRRGLNPLRKIQAESRSWKERGATGAPQRPQDSPVGNSSLFKKGQRDRWTDAHVQKDEIRLVPHTT